MHSVVVINGDQPFGIFRRRDLGSEAQIRLLTLFKILNVDDFDLVWSLAINTQRFEGLGCFPLVAGDSQIKIESLCRRRQRAGKDAQIRSRVSAVKWSKSKADLNAGQGAFLKEGKLVFHAAQA